MAVSERHQKRRTEGCDVESHENMTEEEDGRCGDGERLLQCLVDVRLFNTIEWSMWGGIKSYFLFFFFFLHHSFNLQSCSYSHSLFITFT